MHGRQQILDALLRYPAGVKCSVAFGLKRIGVQGNQGILGCLKFEGVIECQETGQVFRVGD
jgi:hypothetical protein